MRDPFVPAAPRCAAGRGTAALVIAVVLGVIAAPSEAVGPATGVSIARAAAPAAPATPAVPMAPATPAASAAPAVPAAPADPAPVTRPGRVPDQVWSTNPRPLPVAPVAPVAPAGTSVITPVIIIPVSPHRHPGGTHHHPGGPRPQPSAPPPVLIHRPDRP